MNSRPATAADARAELARRELARRHLADWCEQGPPTMRGPVVLRSWQRDLCARLETLPERIRRGERPRVVIGAHPQGGKSEVTARRGPVWFMAQHGIHVALGSYADTLAVEHSREARALASCGRARAVWPHLRPTAGGALLGPDGRAIRDTDDDWGIPHPSGGAPVRYFARGVGGGVSGRSLDLFIIDDPFKDETDAASQARRDAVWAWYRSAVHARVNDAGGGIVIMHTRWHQDDLVGRVLAHAKETGETWEVWNYPVIAGDGDLLGRAPGELLDGWTEAKVRETRALGESLWQAAYQQSPTSPAGNVIKREWTTKRHGFTRENFAQVPWDRVWSTCDPTFGKSATSDYVSIQVWGQRGTMRYLLDRVSARMTAPELRAAYLDLHAKWPEATVRLVEKTANGQGLHDELVGKLEIILVPVSSNVVPGKFQTTAHLWEAGCVILPDPSIAPWVGEYVEQIVTVPAAAHDDDAAATAHALTWSVEQGAVPAFDPAAHLAAAQALGGWGEERVAVPELGPGTPLRW